MADTRESGENPRRDSKSLLRRRLQSLRGRVADRMERLFEVKWAWSLLFLVVLGALVVEPRIGAHLPVLPAGSVASDDIVSPASVELEDEVATQELRLAARNSVPPVYEFDSGSAEQAVATIRRLFEEGRGLIAEEFQQRGASAAAPDHDWILAGLSDYPAPEPSIVFLIEAGFDAAIEARLGHALRQTLRHRVVGSRAILLAQSGRVALRDTRTGREWKEQSLGEILSLDEARQLGLRSLREAGSGSSEAQAMGPLLSDLIAPNLILNGALTEARRVEAEARIEPLIVRIPKGKVLIRRGDLVSEETARTLQSFNRAREASASGRVILGNLLLLSLLLFFMSRYVFMYQTSYRRERRLFALMIVIMVLGLTLDRGFEWLFGNLVDNFQMQPYANPAYYRAMIPVATGSMLITLLMNPRVGMAYALFSVPLFGMLMDWDLALLLFCLLSNLAGIYGISAYRQRTALIRAGIVLGVVNAVAVLGLQSIVGQQVPGSHLLFQMFCGFAGGILVAILVSFLLPLLEWLFSVLTDVRLLELSTLNNPLLRRLAVEAPGSYNHSVLVGTLAEAAAEAIGANALFCRVAAYYHDVGKMAKPGYFVENQVEGLNRHDHLSPHMSALVIASHVREGIELARSHGLPQQVLDIIPQHHGTRKINYFYEKARQTESPQTGPVRESDFRYPGPKPQSREAAIFMLSDSIEAAARTLEDPSPARFKGLIQRITSDVMTDEQFSECDLTFAELEKTKAAFLKTLCSIYHHRVDYPGFDFERVAGEPFSGSRSHAKPATRARQWGR